jgi:hypothetical protein
MFFRRLECPVAFALALFNCIVVVNGRSFNSFILCGKGPTSWFDRRIAKGKQRP